MSDIMKIATKLRRIANELDEIARGSQPDLFGAKPPPKEKSQNSIFNRLKDAWLGFYTQEKDVAYYWKGKDSFQLKLIIKQIERAANKDLTDDEIEDVFKLILSKIKDIDKWLYDHLDLPKVSSKLIALMASIKKQKEDVGGNIQSMIKELEDLANNGNN